MNVIYTLQDTPSNNGDKTQLAKCEVYNDKCIIINTMCKIIGYKRFIPNKDEDRCILKI